MMLLLRHKNISAFPAGAGSCAAGDNSVAGIHRSRGTAVNATFAETGMVLTFGGNSYLPGSVIPLLPGLEYHLSVNTNGEAFFRGILIRFQALEGQYLGASLAPKENTKLAEHCRPPSLTGLSHYDSTIKGSASGRFITNSPGRIRLDINVVIGNEPELSIWGYANYTIEVADIGIQIVPTTFAPIAPSIPPASWASAPAPAPVGALPTIIAPSGSGQDLGKFFYLRQQGDF